MSKKEESAAAALRAIEALTKKHAQIGKAMVSLDLSADPARWDRLIRRLGRKEAFAAAGRVLCREFRLKNGRAFRFSDRCVANELGYHMDVYLRVMGFSGYPLHLTSLVFTRASLIRHCRSMEILEKDLEENWKQSIVFRYRRGEKERQAEEACRGTVQSGKNSSAKSTRSTVNSRPSR